MRRFTCSSLLPGFFCGAGRPVSRRQKLRKQRPACEAGGLRPDGGTGGGRRSAAWRRNWRRQAVCGLTAELTAAGGLRPGGGWQAAAGRRPQARLAELRVDFSRKLCYSVLNRQEGYG